MEAKWEKVRTEEFDEIQLIGGSEGPRYIRSSSGKADANLDKGMGKTAMSKDFPQFAGGPTHGMKIV